MRARTGPTAAPTSPTVEPRGLPAWTLPPGWQEWDLDAAAEACHAYAAEHAPEARFGAWLAFLALVQQPEPEFGIPGGPRPDLHRLHSEEHVLRGRDVFATSAPGFRRRAADVEPESDDDDETDDPADDLDVFDVETP